MSAVFSTPTADNSTFCPRCPLSSGETGSPVFGESHVQDRFIVLGEAPGTHECAEGRPFVGPSGIELQMALEKAGVRRDECFITNVIGCRPPQNDLEALRYKIRRKNKKLLRKDPSGQFLEMPWVACRPRLAQELDEHPKLPILALGKTAATAIRQGASSIMALRGSCEEVDGRKVAYTLHPAFVLRNPAWRWVFQRDVAKAFRFFRGDLEWKDPQILITQDPLVLLSQFATWKASGAIVAYDVETDGIDTSQARLRCIGFSDGDLSLVVPLRTIGGDLVGKTQSHRKTVHAILCDFLTCGHAKLIGHNAGQFDRLIVEQQLGVTPTLAGDTILLSLLADNELPHGLGFCGSAYTDFTESWKADHTATNAGSDKELWTYCAKDAAVTVKIAKPLAKVVARREQDHLIHRERMLQELGATMQRNGMRLDRERHAEHSRDLAVKAVASKLACQKFSRNSALNPASPQQVAALLFETWKLPVYKVNEKSGDPSVDADTLRVMSARYPLDADQKEFIDNLRKFRRAHKILGTYIRPFQHHEWLHPSYNRLPATGRYSSSGPNSQNIPYPIRDMFIPGPGLVFVGADMDQLEYRVIAEEAKAKHSIKWINDGLDPHNETMEIVYGKGVWDLEGAPGERAQKGSKKFKNTRDVTKNTRYAWQYAASAKRIHEQITSVEDGDGNLLFASIGLDEVRGVVAGLRRADPEIPSWWEGIQETYRVEGFIADSLWGRRRYFRNDDKINEMVNHPIQAGGVHIVHEAMIELFYGPQDWFATEPAEPSPLKKPLPMKWLTNHGHDALYLSPEKAVADEVVEILQTVMTRRRKTGALLTYTAEAGTGFRWNEL